MRPAVPLEDRQRWMRERNGGPTRRVAEHANVLDFAQRHYTPNELAGMWGMHPSTVRRIFERIPGVLQLLGSGSRGSRRYVSLRIPESIAVAWYREHVT